MVVETIVSQIGAIIVAVIATIGLFISTRASNRTSEKVDKTNEKVQSLEVKNDAQHAQAEVARQLYNQRRDRDHKELVENDKLMAQRMAILEQAIIGHIEWEETGKYRDLLLDHARLRSERQEIAALVAEAAKNGGEFPLDRIISVLAAEA